MTVFENNPLFVLRHWRPIGYTKDHSVGEKEIVFQQQRVCKEKHVTIDDYVLQLKVHIKAKTLFIVLENIERAFHQTRRGGFSKSPVPSLCCLYDSQYWHVLQAPWRKSG